MGARAAVAALVAFAAAWGALLAASAWATPFPIVLSDEANFLLPALFGDSEANHARWGVLMRIPAPLFHALYGALPGDDPYRAAKLMNAACIAAVAAPACVVARRFLSARDAALFAAVAIALPTSAYSRYFMPESLFVLGAWIVFALALVPGAPRAGRAAVAGAAIGALTLVKPHAAALGFAVAAFIAWEGPRDRRVAARIVALVAGAALGRAALAMLLTGLWWPPFAGTTYAQQLAAAPVDWGRLAAIAAGHALALALLLGVPLAVLACGLRRNAAPEAQPWRTAARFAACVLGATLAMCIWYSEKVSWLDPVGAPATRLHARYYLYALPLVPLAYAAWLRTPRGEAGGPPLRDFVAVAAIGAVGLAATGHHASVVDFPEIALLFHALTAVPLAAGAALALAVAWRWRRARFAAAAPLVWWGAVALGASAIMVASPFLGRGFAATDVDRALASPAALALRGRDDVLVVGTHEDAIALYRTLFHLRARPHARLVPAGSVLQPADVPPDARSVLLLPGVRYAGGGAPRALGPLTLQEAAR